jgi:hypothetical protein
MISGADWKVAPSSNETSGVVAVAEDHNVRILCVFRLVRSVLCLIVSQELDVVRRRLPTSW